MSLLVEESRRVIEKVEKCPKCGGKLIVRISKEPNQHKELWTVVHCMECDFWGTEWR